MSTQQLHRFLWISLAVVDALNFSFLKRFQFCKADETDGEVGETRIHPAVSFGEFPVWTLE